MSSSGAELAGLPLGTLPGAPAGTVRDTPAEPQLHVGARRDRPFLIWAPRVVPATAGTGVLAPGHVAIRCGVITEVAAGEPARPPDLRLPSGLLAPGLIDLQLNGCVGVDLSHSDGRGWSKVVRHLPGTGTTAFLPTLLSAPVGQLVAAFRSVRDMAPQLSGGARVLGLHLEGPFLAPGRAGAHTREWLAEPTPAAVSRLVEAGAGVLRVVTLAPEVPGGMAAIALLAAAGMLVSIGHSDATGSQTVAAADAGARMVTHLFNALRPFHHREVGVAGQALIDPRLTCGLIADGRHVAPAAVALAFAAAPGRVCLVTDSVSAAGMPPGRYALGGTPITLPRGEGEAPIRADGTLAGSVLRMDQAVANAVAAGVDLAQAVTAATRVPADLLGRPDLGRIAAGSAADLLWLGDDLRTRAAWVGGRQVFPRS